MSSYNPSVFLSADRRDGLRCSSGWMPDTAISPPNRHLDTVVGRLTLADIGQGLPSNTLVSKSVLRSTLSINMSSARLDGFCCSRPSACFWSKAAADIGFSKPLHTQIGPEPIDVNRVSFLYYIGDILMFNF